MNKNKQAGVTIIEMVVVVLMFTFIMGALFTLVDRHNTLYNYENALISANGSARTVMNEVDLYTLQAHNVLASQVINGTTYNSGAHVMVLQVPAKDSSGNIVQNAWDYVVFYTSGTNIWELISSDPSSTRISGQRLLSSSLSSLTFTYDNASFPAVKKVAVDLQTAQSYKAQSVKSHLTEQIRLRNF